MAMSIILLAPSWGGMINGMMTLSGAWHKLRTDPILRFLVVSLAFYGDRDHLAADVIGPGAADFLRLEGIVFVTVAATQMACSWDLEANIETAENLAQKYEISREAQDAFAAAATAAPTPSAVQNTSSRLSPSTLIPRAR